MAYCRKCGNHLLEGAKYCPQCGEFVYSNHSIIQTETGSEVNENGTLPFWERLVYFLIPYFGSIATIVLWAKDKESKAKTALLCSIVGSFVMIGIPFALSYYQSLESDSIRNEKYESTDGKKQNNVDEDSKKIDNQMKKYAGKYYYNPYIGNTNAQLNFFILLNPDGSFVHQPSDETTKDFITMLKVIEGADFPDGGRWKVEETIAGPGIILEFNGSWGRSTINPKNNCLEISNLNGHRFKTILRKN